MIQGVFLQFYAWNKLMWMIIGDVHGHRHKLFMKILYIALIVHIFWIYTLTFVLLLDLSKLYIYLVLLDNFKWFNIIGKVWKAGLSINIGINFIWKVVLGSLCQVPH